MPKAQPVTINNISFPSQSAAAKHFQVHLTTIGRLLRGRQHVVAHYVPHQRKEDVSQRSRGPSALARSHTPLRKPRRGHWGSANVRSIALPSCLIRSIPTCRIRQSPTPLLSMGWRIHLSTLPPALQAGRGPRCDGTWIRTINPSRIRPVIRSL